MLSPSRQRQQLSSARDWNAVDAWLNLRFARGTPPFERTPETLKILLALVACNEAADEDRDILEDAEDQDAGLLQSIEASLTKQGSQALEIISASAVALGVAIPEPERYASNYLRG
jgi:HAUS augmin-like complex subunit 1